ncbi:MAG: SDR family NAD(P)-dependent oxidoreductase [Thermoleophilaceae bacterium]
MSERTAIVTGSSSGIGEETAKRLARDGWRLLLVARREERLQKLAQELGAEYVAVDLTAADAPERVRARVEELWGGRLDLLVNNAGSSWHATFGEGGYENVRRTMDVNFDAVVRLTEALLPLLRASAPSSLVNVSSIAARVAQADSGAYSASKFALAGWTEALRFEEKAAGVHVGLVLPGFVSTEGFPQAALKRSARTRWLVSTPDKVADAIVRAGPGGRAEVAVPRPWGLVPRMRYGLPGLTRRIRG